MAILYELLIMFGVYIFQNAKFFSEFSVQQEINMY